MAGLLLFCFPLFTMSIRSWASGIYYLLALVALFTLRRPDPPLSTGERVFIGMIVFYLAATIVANTLSGWTNASIRWYEADFRFLLAIPIFLILRRYPEAVMGLFRAVPVAAILAGLYVLFGTLLSEGRFYGPYGPIYNGNVAALLAMLSLVTMRMETWPLRVRIPLHLVGTALALLAVVLSGTRGAWLAAAITLPVALVLVLRGWEPGVLRRRLTAGAVVIAVIVLGAGITINAGLTTDRLGQAVAQTDAYLNAESIEHRIDAANSPVGIRLEQWRAALMLFSENPLFGLGVGNVSHEINRLVAQGVISPAIEVHDADEGRGSHLHSAYFDALVFKGIIGLVALIGILVVPLVLVFRLTKKGHPARDILVIHVISFAIFSLTEDPFIRNNFTSVYLIFLLGSAILMFTADRQRSMP